MGAVYIGVAGQRNALLTTAAAAIIVECVVQFCQFYVCCVCTHVCLYVGMYVCM